MTSKRLTLRLLPYVKKIDNSTLNLPVPVFHSTRLTLLDHFIFLQITVEDVSETHLHPLHAC